MAARPKRASARTRAMRREVSRAWRRVVRERVLPCNRPTLRPSLPAPTFKLDGAGRRVHAVVRLRLRAELHEPADGRAAFKLAPLPGPVPGSN